VCPRLNAQSIPLTPMRYVLRADASASIGAGHVMRSSAIAEELIARGKDVIFVGRSSDLPWVEERIKSLGFTNIYEDTSAYNSGPENDILILDSYEIDVDDSFIEPSKWFRVIAIVDEQTPSYSCGLKIHPGLDSLWTGDSSTPILAGPNFIPFRKSLSLSLASKSQVNGTIKIIVVAGGSDPHNLVTEVARILLSFSDNFEAYLFSNSTSKETLDARFHIVEIGTQLEKLTQNADLVLTTSSTSSLEFIARGLCVGVACSVDNQEQYYNSLGDLGVAAQIGFRNSDSNWELDKVKIHLLVNSPEFRKELVTKAIGLIDFKGASRIADAILNIK